MHSDTECDKFAYQLLNNNFYVKMTRRKNPDNEKFVMTVLDKWYKCVDGRALPCTWKSLTASMKSACLDGEMIKIIEDNTGNYCNVLVCVNL